MADGDNLLLGMQNTSSAETHITRSGATPNVSSLVVDNDNGHCVVGNSSTAFFGVVGTSEAGDGVLGTSATRYGVVGLSQQDTGVVGRCEDGVGTGVRGEAVGTGTGVIGNAPGPGGGNGVWGEAADGGTGVVGKAPDGGTGVWGEAGGTGTGVWGEAPDGGDGVIGNAPSGGHGITGQADGGGHGVVGSAPSPGLAGVFWGNVYISGDLTTVGAKSAVLSHSDGSLRRVYALESPESWFEDLGRAEVVDGRAEVELDNEFAAMVQTDDYHVFLTPEGDTQGLYVSARRPGGFEVHEQQGGTSNLTFSYRVVAKRSDIEAQRLQRVEAPTVRAEALPPQPPELPDSAGY
jgi:hypothetical protein